MIYKDKLGRLRHEKSKPIEETITCSKCGYGYIYSKSPLVADEQKQPRTKITKNRKTGEIIKAQTITEMKKTGKYICKSCA